MPLTPKDWNVVLLGFWNCAILTPSGIAKRLFRLDAGTPVAVFVAIDMPAPHKVNHSGVTVVAANNQLVVQPDRCDFQSLQKAMEIACRALEELPETPVVAAGINVKYTCEEPLDALQQVTRHDWLDARLSDKKYEITGRSLSRSLKLGDGQINLGITEDADGKYELYLNFHRASNSVSELRSWLNVPVADIEHHARQVLLECTQINVEGIENVAETSAD